LAALGVAVGPASLPARSRCPACGRDAMDIFQDTAEPGYWFACGHCRAGGGPADLAAACWLVGPEEAAARLANQGLPAQAAGQTDRSARLFWEAARVGLAHPGLGRCPRSAGRAGVDPADSPLRLDRHGKVGVVSLEQLADFFPGVRPPGGRPGRRSRKAGFRCGLVLPAESPPGRLTGFLVVADATEGSGVDAVFVPASGPDGPGVFFPDAADGPGRVYLVADPLVASVARTKPDQAARVVGVWPESAPSPYLAGRLAGRPAVLVAPEPSPGVFRHAAAYDARVSFGRLSPGVFWGPDLDRAWARSEPWHEAAGKYLRHRPAGEIDGLVAAMRLPAEAKKRLPTGFGGRVVRVGRREVRETAAGWAATATGEPLSAFLVRVDQVLVAGTSRWCRGRAIAAGREYPFTLPADEFDADPLGCAARVILAGGGDYPFYQHTWRSRARDLVYAFGSPETVRVSGASGFDPAAGVFRLPRFTAGAAGVRPPDAPFAPDAPGANLPAPGGLTAEHLAAVVAGPGALSVLAGVLAQVLAPVVGVASGGLVVAGPPRTGRAYALACGCPPASRKRADPPGWPAVWGQSSHMVDRLAAQAADRVVCVADRPLARQAASTAGVALASVFGSATPAAQAALPAVTAEAIAWAAARPDDLAGAATPAALGRQAVARFFAFAGVAAPPPFLED
jgi:hypothetical protein